METSLSLSMANAFMPCLSTGSHASLASFPLLMCLKRNLLLLFMSLQFSLKIYFSILSHLTCKCLWPCLIRLVGQDFNLMEAALMFLKTSLYLQFSYPFRICGMHLMSASDTVFPVSENLYQIWAQNVTYKNFILQATPFSKSQKNAFDLILREFIVSNGGFFHA